MNRPTEVPPFRAPHLRRGDVVVRSHADAVGVLRETDFHKPPVPWLPIKRARILNNMFLALDPPVHTKLRKVVAPFFTPTAVASYREELRALAEQTLNRAQRPFDVVRDFAYPYPFAFACRLLGARVEDWPELSAWTRTLTAALDEPMPLRVRDVAPIVREVLARRLRPVAVLRATGDVVRYARACLEAANAPVTDALSAAVARGEISADEAAATWVLLFFAGHETSANLIANAVHALARHPDQLAQVRRDPALIAAAVEETLRWDPPVPLNARMARTATYVAGEEVAARSSAHLSIRDANRDAAIVDDGDAFRVDRGPSPVHLSFGFGTHFCLGAFLARLEVEIGLAALLTRAPDLELDGEPQRRTTITVSGFDSLPLALPR